MVLIGDDNTIYYQEIHREKLNFNFNFMKNNLNTNK